MFSYKPYPSKYELYHIVWPDIEYDKEKLIKFIRRLKLLKSLSFIRRYKNEYLIMKEIYESYDTDKLKGLLNNDENISRLSIIEKWAKIGAIEILTSNTYSKNTFSVISNLSLKDYQILIKRIEELIHIAKNITTQTDKNTNEIPGS